MLSTFHLALLGSSFIVTFGLLGWLLKRPGRLRRHPRRAVAYGGVVLIVTIIGGSVLVLNDSPLRIGLLASGLLILIVGIIDEHVTISPARQLLWQVVIAVLAVSWGWSVRYVSHPFAGGVIPLDWAALGGFVLPGSILTVLWLVLLMNAMNWLDGVDGLATSVGLIACVTLAGVSLLPHIQDHLTLQLASIGAGALLGFLLWNFPPARVYLGTTGSWLLGLYIGLIAIGGGGKVATTLLVLALPVLDLLSVSLQRLLGGRAPWRGDTTRHLHFRLLSQGVPARVVTLGAMVVTSILGVAAVLLQTRYKLVALTVAAAMLGVVTLSLMHRQRRLVRL